MDRGEQRQSLSRLLHPAPQSVLLAPPSIYLDPAPILSTMCVIAYLFLLSLLSSEQLIQDSSVDSVQFLCLQAVMSGEKLKDVLKAFIHTPAADIQSVVALEVAAPKLDERAEQPGICN